MVVHNWKEALSPRALLESFVTLVTIMGTEACMCIVVYLYMFIFSAYSLFEYDNDPDKMMRAYKPTLGFLTNFALGMFLATSFTLSYWWHRPYFIYVLGLIFALIVALYTDAFYWTYTAYDFQGISSFIIIVVLLGLCCNYYIHWKRIRLFGECFKRVFLPVTICGAIMGGYIYVLGFLIPLQLLAVQLGLRLVVHQVVIYAARFVFWICIPANDKTLHSYGKYFIVYCPQYVSAFIGRWIINNSGHISNVAVVTIASSIQTCLIQCFSIPGQEYLIEKYKKIGGLKGLRRELSKELGLDFEPEKNSESTSSNGASVASSSEVVVEVSETGDKGASIEMAEANPEDLANSQTTFNPTLNNNNNNDNREQVVTGCCAFSCCTWPEGLERVESKASRQIVEDDVDENNLVQQQAIRTYESISRVCEETIAAPAFAIFLTNLTNVFYFPEGPSSVYFVWTALLQLAIQFFFDFVSVVVLRAQGADLSAVRKRRPRQLVFVKLIIAFIATAITLFAYETHITVLPR